MAEVVLYTLSSCIHCRNLKKMLDEYHVEYTFQDVDMVSGEERQQLVDTIKKLNPDLSFPTSVIDGKVFVGFREKPIKEALGIT